MVGLVELVSSTSACIVGEVTISGTVVGVLYKSGSS